MGCGKGKEGLWAAGSVHEHTPVLSTTEKPAPVEL
jgi:hypothetical protein